MKDTWKSLFAGFTSVAASLPWWWILTGGVALLGSAGSAAASQLVGWLAPVLLCASVLLLGWSFYNLYGRGMGTRLTTVITWFSLVFIVVFWTLHLTWGVWATGNE